VPEADLIRLQAADLDLATGTLIIQRGYRHRIVFLDEVTEALASQWLRYRHQRWPGSRNPYLLVSQQTAADTSPVGPTMIGAMFEPLGVRPGAAAAGPHPGRGPPHRRPGPPGPRLRHHREHRHLLRPRRSPRTAVGHPQVTALAPAPEHVRARPDP
jgi:integrase